MRAVLVLLIVGVGLCATLFNRLAGFLLYTWFAFFRPQEWSYHQLTHLRLSLITSAVFAASALGTGTLPNFTHRLSIGTLAILLAGGVAHLNAIDPAASSNGLFKLALVIVITHLGVSLIKTRDQFSLVVAVLAGSLGFHGAKVGVGYLIRGGARFSNVGLGGMFSDNNDFGFAIARNIFLLILVVGLVHRKWLRLGFGSAALLSCFAVVSTFSRGAFLTIAAGALVYVWYQPRRWTYLALGTLLVGSAAVLAPRPEGYLDRLSTITTYEEQGEGSALSRLYFWGLAVDMVKTYPQGVGLGNYPARYQEFDTTDGAYGTSRAVHSTHFQTLSELGVLGFATYGWLVAVSFGILRRIRKTALAAGDVFALRASTGLLASLAAFVIGGSFLSQLLNEMNWYLFALVVSLDRLHTSSDAGSTTPAMASVSVPA